MQNKWPISELLMKIETKPISLNLVYHLNINLYFPFHFIVSTFSHRIHCSTQHSLAFAHPTLLELLSLRSISVYIKWKLTIIIRKKTHFLLSKTKAMIVWPSQTSSQNSQWQAFFWFQPHSPKPLSPHSNWDALDFPGGAWFLILSLLKQKDA